MQLAGELALQCPGWPRLGNGGNARSKRRDDLMEMSIIRRNTLDRLTDISLAFLLTASGPRLLAHGQALSPPKRAVSHPRRRSPFPSPFGPRPFLSLIFWGLSEHHWQDVFRCPHPPAPPERYAGSGFQVPSSPMEQTAGLDPLPGIGGGGRHLGKPARNPARFTSKSRILHLEGSSSEGQGYWWVAPAHQQDPSRFVPEPPSQTDCLEIMLTVSSSESPHISVGCRALLDFFFLFFPQLTAHHTHLIK